jgi:hypothetical protein
VEVLLNFFANSKFKKKKKKNFKIRVRASPKGLMRLVGMAKGIA